MAGRQKYTIQKKYGQGSNSRYLLSLGLIIVLVCAIGGFAVYKSNQPKGPIPRAIKQQIAFVIFYPSITTGAAVNAASFKYDTQSKLLSYVVSYSGRSITVAEQATPQNFIDIPQAYDKLTESLNEFASFDSYYDKVSLVHPKEFNGQQSAVMNSKGTLIFAHPTNGDLTVDQWKKLFNGFEIIR
ncbi:MAG: hypothetical protein QFB87_01860 [Patescibacteria group bacterium]|nr:hypothetical protein [Patescibacteria group bacterium]